MRILVVDDEPMVLEVNAEILNQLGHETIGARDGLDGIIKFNANLGSIDMVLTDLKMPKVSGVTLAFRCKSIRKNIPVVIMSGFGMDDVHDDFKMCIELYIQKPVMLKDLLSVLETCNQNKQSSAEIKIDVQNNVCK